MSADILFDPTIPQPVSFEVPKNGKKYPVTHIFKPLSDAAYISLEKSRDVRMKEAEDADSADAFRVEDKSFAASVDFWNDQCEKVAGYAIPVSEAIPVTDDLRLKITGETKNFAVQNMLFFVDIVPNPLADADEPFPFETADDEVVKIRVFHQGKELELSHTLAPVDNTNASTYRTILSSNYMVRGNRLGKTEQKIPSKAKPLGDLYDKTVKSVEGYKDGLASVPLVHKVRVVQEVYGNSAQSISGN